MAISELLGLAWRSADLDAGRLGVVRVLMSAGPKLPFDDTKTKRSRRSIALDGVTVSALREHRRQQLEERMAYGLG